MGICQCPKQPSGDHKVTMHRESDIIANHVINHLRKISSRPKHPVTKDNVYFSAVQSWDPVAGQEVVASLTDDWLSFQTICQWAARPYLISQAGNIQGSWRGEKWPGLVKRPPDWESGHLLSPSLLHHKWIIWINGEKPFFFSGLPVPPLLKEGFEPDSFSGKGTSPK